MVRLNSVFNSVESKATSLGHHRTLNIHKSIKAFKCELCDKSFKLEDTLKMHLKTVHQNIKNLKCSYCDKKFGQTGQLETHFKTAHENIK